MSIDGRTPRPGARTQVSQVEAPVPAVPGKRTLTEALAPRTIDAAPHAPAVQMRTGEDSPTSERRDDVTPVVPDAPRPTLQRLFGGPEVRSRSQAHTGSPVAPASLVTGAKADATGTRVASAGAAARQMPAVQLRSREQAHDAAAVHAAAARGAATSTSRLPHGDAIQRSFGRHDIAGIQAHTGPEAAASAAAMGAQAYATGDHVVLGNQADLHTAAHEAAHVVQQRGGIQLKGGVGEVGDAYEQHADAVADKVVRGESAEALLAQMPGGGQRGSAIQRSDKTPSRATTGADDDITPPVGGIDRTGFIDTSDGAFIRTGPRETGGTPVRAEPLPPATRVFATGRHPTAIEWMYVTAFLPHEIVRGYIQGFRVNIELPEPLAELRQLVGGETPESLAKEKFGHAVRDGHDLRFYENVLLHVNKGRAGISGTFQDPGVVGGGANNIRLTAGHRIWLVSAEFARSLEGIVPSGSRTGGAVAKAKRFAGHVQDILHSVTESRHYLGEVAGEYAEAIREHQNAIFGIVGGFLMMEAASALLAATPTGVSQIIAVLIQLTLSALGAAGMVEAGAAAMQHGVAWLTAAWTANGNPEKLANASREFIKMLVSLAMAALSYLGAKGNYGNALKIANSMPTGALPALAVGRGGQMGGASAGTAVLIGPGTGSLGVGGAMMSKVEGEEGRGKEDAPSIEQATGVNPSREARINELAKDPAHGGAIKEKTLREAEVGVSLEEAGKLPKPITRDPSGAAEFIDGMKQRWDVKRFNSKFPPRKGGYALRDSLEKIESELAKGENVIIDTIDLRPEHIAELRAAVSSKGWDARVIWH